ncbi:proteasome-domain-containing protein [Gonapodya prolifera JEL478]|uniref:Proteasome subunit beta n=1 Tax=Gonapodya prolifera (strain JEL478) TaxID=1344416 RepID=A0A139AMG5_GONPJ|nr:proteasome-domain-containing protein [Gonapodya prolifera JEL478]|eukprot:KXS17960.1 proteasome-domain-containing protein [Gonapodya prolifera JEL478]
METLLGIVGKDYTLLAADAVSARSIVVMKRGEDKSRPLNDHNLMVFTGEPGDAVNFAEFIQANLKLYEIRNATPLSTKAIASYTRRELADSLRSRNSYAVNLLIGGVDPKTKTPELYWMDYLGAMVKVNHGAHGYAAYFCSSVFDRHWKADMSLDEGIALLQKCLHELRTRLVVNQSVFIVKVVDSNGIREIQV